MYSCESLLKTLGDGDRPRGVKRMRGMAGEGAADLTAFGLRGVAATGLVLAVVGTIDAVGQMV